MTDTTHLAEQAALAIGRIQQDAALLQTLGAQLLPHLTQPLDAVIAWVQSPERTDEELEYVKDVVTTFLIVGSLGGEPEPEDVSDGVVLPAEPLPNEDEFNASSTVALDPSLSSYDQAKALSSMITPGTRIIVPEGSECSALKLGGGNHPTLMSDGGPVRDIEITGGGVLRGLELHDGIGGDVRVRDLTVRPMHAGDQAPIRCVGMVPGLDLYLFDVSLEGTPGCTSWLGRGMKQGAILQGCWLRARNVVADPSQEHTIYPMNMRGGHVTALQNLVDVLATPDGDVIVGNGRTLIKHENRTEDSGGGIGGLPSTGTWVVENCRAQRCGHEGIHAGGKPSGGSDFSVGGFTGEKVVLRNNTSFEPYCGSLAIYQERSPAQVTEGNPAGVRVWQAVGDVGIQHWDEGLTHSVRYLEVEGHTIDRGNVPEGRIGIQVSGVAGGWITGVGDEKVWVDYQITHLDLPSIPPCGPLTVTP